MTEMNTATNTNAATTTEERTRTTAMNGHNAKEGRQHRDSAPSKNGCSRDEEEDAFVAANITSVASDEEGIELSSPQPSSLSSITHILRSASEAMDHRFISKEGKLRAVAATATEYDMALRGGGNASNEEDGHYDDDDDDAAYQCQLWTASYPNDDDNENDTINNNISGGIFSSAFDTLGSVGGGGGDIWSTEAFSLPSPLHDILSSNKPLSLLELLRQDELLQELRGCELKLVEFFSRVDVVSNLVRCLVYPVPYYHLRYDDNDDENNYKDNEGVVRGRGGGGGRERWCAEEEERRRQLKLKREQKQSLELQKKLEGLACRDEEGDAETDEDEDEALRRNPKLFVSSPRENGEEPNVETQWISPAVSPGKSSKRGLPGGWIFNHGSGDELVGKEGTEEEEEEEHRTPEEEYDLRFVRYPYMACEVLCSEVGTTLDVLVDGYIIEDDDDDHSNDNAKEDEVKGLTTPSLVEEYDDVDILSKSDDNSNPDLQVANPLQPRDKAILQSNQQEQQSIFKITSNKRRRRILDLLFSVLIDTPPSSLDDRRAGYLEKLLVVLFRRRSQAMAEYMNTSLIMTDKSAPVAKQLFPSSYKSFAQISTKKERPSSIIEKFPSPNAPPMLMCALLDHLHSHSIMHILQRLLVPSPLRQVSSKESIITDEKDVKRGADVAASGLTDSDDDDNPNSAMNNDFMNAINQMNGNQLINLHDTDDEDVDVDDEDDLENDLTHLFQCDWSERPDCVLALLLDRLEGKTDSFLLGCGFPVGYSNDDSSKECGMEDDENDVAFSCSQHASDILVTIIQNSSLKSPLMISLSSDPALKRVLDIASLSKSVSSSTGESKELRPEFVPNESIMTCAITVLESLVLQLGGYGAVGIEGGGGEHEVSQQTNLSEIGPHTPPPLASPHLRPSSPEASTADASTLVSYLPELLNEFSSLLTHPVITTWLAPAQYTGGKPRLLLGTSRLRIVRLVEALVLLGDASVDFDLQHSNILKYCIDLFWEFEWCSMLHQSVANLLVHVFEGGGERSGLQEYLLEKCQLLDSLIDAFGYEGIKCDAEVDAKSDSGGEGGKDNESVDGDDSKKSNDDDTHDDIGAVAPVSDEDVDSSMEQEDSSMNECGNGQEVMDYDEPSQPIPAISPIASGVKGLKQIRKGYMGHVIIICQALAHACTNTGDVYSELVGDVSEAGGTQQERSLNVDGDLKQTFSTTSPLPKLHSSPTLQGKPVGKSSKPSQINFIIRRDPQLYEKWQQFVASTLAFEMSVQTAPLGGQMLKIGPTSDSQNRITSIINDTSDDFLGEPSGHFVFGGSGATVGDIDMDENDLDIAASMMENLSLPGGSDDSQSRGHNRRRAGMGAGSGRKESNSGHIFGSVIPSAKGFNDYVYDDPLGVVHPFDNEDENDRKLERGSEDDDIMSDAMVVPRGKGAESTSSDESSVNDGNDDDDDDVPVMDLFAGNVAFDEDGHSYQSDGWANFDSFDADPSQKDDSSSKDNDVSTSKGDDEDLFSFSKTPFDLVDTLEDE